MWGWNNKMLDLETPLSDHERFLSAQNAQNEAYLCVLWISKCPETTREGDKLALQNRKE